MARHKITVKASFQYFLEPQDYVDQFAEENELDDEAEIDQDALLEFALAKFTEELEEGTISCDEMDMNIDEVKV